MSSEEQETVAIQTPLLQPLEQKGSKKLETFVCFLVAFPTATLNGLAALSGSSSQYGNLHSGKDFADLVQTAGAGRIVYGVVALTASEVVLYYLNKRYLLASGKAAFDLIRRTGLTLRSKVTSTPLTTEDRAGIGENALFFLSITTSLIFAEIGSKTLSFLGIPGQVLGFSLNLSVYFATRFSSAKMYFANLVNGNWKLKQGYLDKLDLLSKEPGAIQLRTRIEDDDPDKALANFLSQIDANWNDLPKDPKRVLLLKYASPFLGYTLVALTSLPILTTLLPSSVQGAESLTHSDIGASNNYQNPGSITFGTFATALTLFFYELNIKKLPKHFLKTALEIYEKFKFGDSAGAIKLFGATLLAFGVSYLTGIGFNSVAESAVDNGYLSYLGSWLSRAMPAGLFTATVTMFWSHLQDLINQTSKQVTVTEETEDALELDTAKASALLKKPQTNIMDLLQSSIFNIQQHPTSSSVSSASSYKLDMTS